MAVASGYPKELPRHTHHVDDEVRIYTRHFLTVHDVTTDRPYVALNATNIPRLGDSHPDEAYARVRTVDADPFEGLLDAYIITVVYTTPIVGLPNSDNPNPLLRPPVISGSSMTITKPLVRADYMGYRTYHRDGTTAINNDGGTPEFSGIPVTNSANVRFTNVPEKEDSIPFLTIVKNEPPVLTSIMQKKATYENKVNLDDFYSIAAAGYAKMGPITFSQQFTNGVAYYEVTYTVYFRTDGWNIEILDQGRYQWVNSDPNDYSREPIVDAQFMPVTSDMLMDGSGFACTDSDPPLPTDVIGAMLIYRESRADGAVNFAPLALLG